MLVLSILVVASPPRPIHDEGWYLATIGLLNRQGLSLDFLNDFPGAAGPTFTLLFASIDKLLGLTLPWLRLVNVALLLATAALIWRSLVVAKSDTDDPALAAAMLLIVPTAGVAAGLALTEMPAAFLSVLSIALLGQSLTTRGVTAAAWSALGGIALGFAILGRQNYLVMLLCLPLAARWQNPSDIWRVLLFAGFAFKVFLPVFIIWGGLVPPMTAGATSGISLANIVRGAGYAGLITLLLAPAIYAPLSRRPAWLVAVAIASVPLAFILSDNFMPLRSVMRILFDGPALVYAATGISLVLAFAAAAFIACFAQHVWDYRDDWLIRLSGTFVLLGLASNAKITHQFSSRYVFVVVPFLIIAVSPAMRVTRWTWAQMTSAAGISLAALASYYFGR